MIECALKICGLVLPSYLSVGHSSEKQVEFLIEFAFSLGTVVEGLLPLKLQHSCRDWRFTLWAQSSYKLQNAGIYTDNVVSVLFNDMTVLPSADRHIKPLASLSVTLN